MWRTGLWLLAYWALAPGNAQAAPAIDESQAIPIARPSTDGNAELSALAEHFFDAQAKADPVYSGTLLSDNRFDHLLTISIAPGERAKRFDMYRDVQGKLAAIDRSKLGPTDTMTYDLLRYQVESRLALEPFPDHLLPLQHLDSIPIQLATFATGQAEQPLRSAKEYEAYLGRIARMPAWIDQAIANMREGIRLGVVQPKVVIRTTIEQVRALATDDLKANPFHRPVLNFPEAISPKDRARLAAAYGDSISKSIVPALRKLLEFLEKDYLPAGLDSVGRGSLPNGAAWYRAWVRDHTTMDLEPEAIHALGLNEVARIHRELAELAPQMGYRGDPKGLLAWVRSNPRYQPFRSDKDVLAAYRAIDAEVRLHLPRLFGRSPKATLRILPEPELTKATASSHYALPAEDGSRPGIFWAVIDDASQYSASDMTALFLHEGQPGHHFHLAMQQEMPLPRFRRLLWINAFGEGWALYAETLGHEMGLYKDPVAYAGFLRLEMVRAARLVVDTGIHAKGWSRGQALAYLQENTGFSEAQSISQIDRYIVWPAQALGYKVGSLKIQELREQAIKAWGSSFDIAAFHDALLEEGALPLPLLEAKMNSWIDTAKHDTELPECRRC